MEGITKTLNSLMSADCVRLPLILLSNVLAGYTLQPVPKRISDAFDTSIPLKFVVLLSCLMVSLHPLTPARLVNSLIACVLVLTVFELLRNPVERRDIDSNRTT